MATQREIELQAIDDSEFAPEICIGVAPAGEVGSNVTSCP
jgi:hypothetical protein